MATPTREVRGLAASTPADLTADQDRCPEPPNHVAEALDILAKVLCFVPTWQQAGSGPDDLPGIVAEQIPPTLDDGPVGDDPAALLGEAVGQLREAIATKRPWRLGVPTSDGAPRRGPPPSSPPTTRFGMAGAGALLEAVVERSLENVRRETAIDPLVLSESDKQEALTVLSLLVRSLASSKRPDEELVQLCAILAEMLESFLHGRSERHWIESGSEGALAPFAPTPGSALFLRDAVSFLEKALGQEEALDQLRVKAFASEPPRLAVGAERGATLAAPDPTSSPDTMIDWAIAKFVHAHALEGEVSGPVKEQAKAMVVRRLTPLASGGNSGRARGRRDATSIAQDLRSFLVLGAAGDLISASKVPSPGEVPAYMPYWDHEGPLRALLEEAVVAAEEDAGVALSGADRDALKRRLFQGLESLPTMASTGSAAVLEELARTVRKATTETSDFHRRALREIAFIEFATGQAVSAANKGRLVSEVSAALRAIKKLSPNKRPHAMMLLHQKFGETIRRQNECLDRRNLRLACWLLRARARTTRSSEPNPEPQGGDSVDLGDHPTADRARRTQDRRELEALFREGSKAFRHILGLNLDRLRSMEPGPDRRAFARAIVEDLHEALDAPASS